MKTDSESGGQEHVGRTGSFIVILSRLMWMVFGPVLSAAILYIIVTEASGWFTAWDAAFAVVLGLMVGARHIEQRSGAAMTATGDPATSEHFERYVKILVPVDAAIWSAANLLGNHVLE